MSEKPATSGALQYTTIKVRLFPTAEQAELFEKTFGCCRYIWNRMLADQRRFYEETGAHFIPTPAKYKPGAPFLREVDNQALIQEHGKLSQAFRVFFKNPESFNAPRFKRKKDDRDSFTACNHVFASGPTIYTTRSGIRMTKAGVVRAVFHRRPQAWWKLKRVTVSRTRTGKYFCSILYECPPRETAPVTPAPETTLELRHGGGTPPPPWMRRSQEKLRKLRREMARMEPGSRNHREAARKYDLLHEHLANQRRDLIHKESRRIANDWDAVHVVDSGPAGGRDGFGMFCTCLRYKLERQGKPFVLERAGA